MLALRRCAAAAAAAPPAPPRCAGPRAGHGPAALGPRRSAGPRRGGVGAAAGPTEAAFTSETATAARQGQARRAHPAQPVPGSRCRASTPPPGPPPTSCRGRRLPSPCGTMGSRLSSMRLTWTSRCPAEVVPRSDRPTRPSRRSSGGTPSLSWRTYRRMREPLHKGEKACPSNATGFELGWVRPGCSTAPTSLSFKHQRGPLTLRCPRRTVAFPRRNARGRGRGCS